MIKNRYRNSAKILVDPQLMKCSGSRDSVSLLPSSNPVFYSPIRTKRETIVTGAVCLVAGVGLGMMLKDCLDGKKNTPTVRGIGPSDLDFFINDTNPPSIDGHTNNPTCIDKPTGQQSSDNQPVLETNTAETISLSPEKETDKVPDAVEQQEMQSFQPAPEVPVQDKTKEEGGKTVLKNIEVSLEEFSQSNRPTPIPLSYPPLFIKTIKAENKAKTKAKRLKAMEALFEELTDGYMKCSSYIYFCYIFGGMGASGTYEPEENDYIDWTGGKGSLQWFILKLYKLEGKSQIRRGTWQKVETCIMLDHAQIPSGTLKNATNKIAKSDQEEIDAVISKVISDVMEGVK